MELKEFKGRRSPEADAFEAATAAADLRMTPEETLANLAELPAENEVPVELPAGYDFACSVEERDCQGNQLFVLNDESEAGITILYLHGGAYVHHLMEGQWMMADQVAHLTSARLFLPIYPLAPVHDYRETYELVETIYRDILAAHPDDRIVIMGDSAGGGLGAGFAQILPELGLPQPETLVLLSPWVDLTMENPDEEDYLDGDPILYGPSLRVQAESWANGTDLKDPRLSPTFGDMSLLKDIHVYVYAGTREIFLPDAIVFDMKLKGAGVDSALFIGEGMNHVWPTTETPEGEKARALIAWQIVG